jgi:serine/threonine protein kinase
MSTQASELLGQLVGEGRYLFSGCLRDGGMAAIFLGEDTTTGSKVIIKVPKLDQVQIDASFRQRFLREIQTLKRLVHPNIVRILCSGEEKGVPFVVLRYLEGGTLGDRMYTGPGQTARPQPPEGLATWLPTIAQILDYIHEHNYVHRDVKPFNILFDGAGKPFLGDLGIARALATQPDLGSLTPEREQPPGTRPYMAPEQINRQKIGPYTDQFALAVVVYEWLAGRRPFSGDRLEDIARSQRQPVTPLQFSLPGLPEGVSQAVSQALSLNPQDRFASCRDFASQVMATLGLGTPPRSGAATQVANNPDTWSLPLSDFEPKSKRESVVRPPAVPIPRSQETGSKSAATWRDAPAQGSPTDDSATARQHRPTALRTALRWSLVLLLLVASALAGSFFLPGTTAQRIVGTPIGALLDAVGAPGWGKREPYEKLNAKEPDKQLEASLAEVRKEKELLAQKLDETETQRDKAMKEREDAEKDRKAAEARLNKAQQDFESAKKDKTAAEGKLAAAMERVKNAEGDRSILSKDKGGIAKELDALKMSLKKAEDSLAEESARAKKAEDGFKAAEKAKNLAAKQLADAEAKLTETSKRADAADKDATAAKMKEKEARAEADRLQAKLKVIDDTLRPSMICFILYNQTDAAISFEIRSLLRTGEWQEWKKKKIPTKKIAIYQSAGGAVAIQGRYETENGTKVVDLDGQVFRGKRDPKTGDIDCWYEFKKSGSDLILQRMPRKP